VQISLYTKKIIYIITLTGKIMKQKLILIVIAIATMMLAAQPLHAAADLGDKNTLDYHGSIRIGTGLTKDGETQVEFQAPGAETNFRLGNEADTNYKLAFDHRYYMDGIKIDTEKHVQSVIMMEGYDKQGNEHDIDVSKLAQMYVSFNNILGEGTNLWVGRRWYKRTSTYMTDHFWLNTGQHSRAAAGIEGVKIFGGNFSTALIMSEDNAVKIAEEDTSPKESVNSTALDFRLENISVNQGGELNFWAYYNQRPENIEAQLDDEDGFGLAAWHTQSIFDGQGKNTIHVMYREGTAVSRSDFNPNPLMNNAAIENVDYLEVATDTVTKLGHNWDLAFTALYRNTQKKMLGEIKETDWFSIGIRPQYTISEHFSVVFEIAHDQVDSDDASGGLTKFTTAFQIGAKPGYWARPVARLFVTVASWDDEFRGDIGGKTFADDTFGWTAGVQGEWWW
jgi:maltoporin